MTPTIPGEAIDATVTPPTQDPPPKFDRLRFFFRGLFLNLLGCWLQSETDFV